MENSVNHGNDKSAAILRESEERYQTLFHSIDEGFCVCEMLLDDAGKPFDYRFLEVNPTFGKQTGLENALGKTMRQIVPNLEEHWFEIYGRVALTGEAVRFVDRSEVMNRWFDVYAFRVGEPDERKFAVLFTNVTERRKIEENQKLLLEITEKIRQAENADDLLFTVSEAVGEHLRVRRCLFNEIDLDGDRETVHRDYCRGTESVAGVHPISEYSPVTSAEMEAGKTVINRDSNTDLRTAEFYEQTYAPNGERAYIAVPLMRENRWVASLWVSDDRPRNWSEQEIGLLEAIAERAWLAVEKLRNEAALRERNRQLDLLARTSQELIFGGKPENEMLQAVFADVSAAVGAEMFFNFTVGDQPQTLRLTNWGGLTQEESDFFAAIRFGEHFCGKVAERREQMVVEKLPESEFPGGEALCAAGVKCYGGFPLVAHGRLIGTIAFATRTRTNFREGELQLIQTVCDQVAATLERSRLFDELSESEERFRNMADHAPVMIWMTEPNAVCTYLSQSWYEFTGQTPETGLGFGWLDATHPDDLERSEKIFLAANEKHEAFQLEYRLRRKDGEYRWAIDSAQPRFGANGEFLGYIGSVIDITGRKRSEELLRESEERFAKAFNSSPLSITITSLNTGKLIEVNETFVNITGYSREEAVGKTTAELGLWQPSVRDKELAVVKSEGQISNTEYHFRMKDGSEIVGLLSAELLEIGGEPCALTVIQDITERKRAEELIRESEEKFRNLANSISQFAWMADASGFIFWYNERWFEYTGTTLEEMQGLGWQKVHHPEEVERVTGKFKRHIDSGEIWEDTFPLRSKTGEYRWFLSRALPIRDENGNIIRWFGTNTDIEEVRQARLQAEQANRLKDEFLATVSHELRTPLNAILGWSNMLQSGKANDETKKRANEVIYRNAKSQAQLIEDLLDVSRIITGKTRIEPLPVGFASVIESAIDTVRPAVDAKSIELETDIDCEPCMINGDVQRLQQVVWNLISNAVKFTPEGGKVVIKLENENARARLTVSDTGKGIEEKFLPYLFERFRQEDASSTRRYGGLGLGLAIVRHLVELHGGTIAVESAGAGRGSTFTVELPLALTNGEAKNLRETLSDGFGKNQTPKQLEGIRVLLVDDEPDTLEMLDAALTNEGADVRVSSSAGDAFEILREWKPDVLISDIAMPDEDGYSLIKKVRELAPDDGGLIPAIAMTAYVRTEDKMRVLASGFQAYIPKPAEPTELITAIPDLINLRRNIKI